MNRWSCLRRGNINIELTEHPGPFYVFSPSPKPCQILDEVCNVHPDQQPVQVRPPRLQQIRQLSRICIYFLFSSTRPLSASFTDQHLQVSPAEAIICLQNHLIQNPSADQSGRESHASGPEASTRTSRSTACAKTARFGSPRTTLPPRARLTVMVREQAERRRTRGGTVIRGGSTERVDMDVEIKAREPVEVSRNKEGVLATGEYKSEGRQKTRCCPLMADLTTSWFDVAK